MLSTVESLTLNPRLASAPTMLLLPQVGFSWSSLTTSFSSSASTRGRPVGLVLAKVHFLATKTRNQRSKVSGVTSVANLSRRRRPTRLATLVTPDTLLRWFRVLVAKKWTFARTNPTGRPRVDAELEKL